MIVGFRHKGLKRLYEADEARLLPAEMLDRIRVILADLDVAKSPRDLDRPSFRLHGLKGRLSGMWSITVRANWRIVFRFADGNAFDIDFLDYH